MFIDKSMTRDVVTVEQHATILEAADLMAKRNIRHLPIVEKDGTLIGIVTDRDVRSAMPSAFLSDEENHRVRGRLSKLTVADIMTRKLVTVRPSNTLEDALLLMHRIPVGAFPVVDQQGKLKGIISVRDVMRAFINVLGIEEPGTLLCIEVENKLGQMKRIVDAISEERIPFGSILVARHWDEDKRAIFPYLLTNQVSNVKRKLEKLGFTLLNPMEWCLEQLPRKD